MQDLPQDKGTKPEQNSTIEQLTRAKESCIIQPEVTGEGPHNELMNTKEHQFSKDKSEFEDSESDEETSIQNAKYLAVIDVSRSLELDANLREYHAAIHVVDSDDDWKSADDIEEIRMDHFVNNDDACDDNDVRNGYSVHRYNDEMTTYDISSGEDAEHSYDTQTGAIVVRSWHDDNAHIMCSWDTDNAHNAEGSRDTNNALRVRTHSVHTRDTDNAHCVRSGDTGNEPNTVRSGDTSNEPNTMRFGDTDNAHRVRSCDTDSSHGSGDTNNAHIVRSRITDNEHIFRSGDTENANTSGLAEFYNVFTILFILLPIAQGEDWSPPHFFLTVIFLFYFSSKSYNYSYIILTTK